MNIEGTTILNIHVNNLQKHLSQFFTILNCLYVYKADPFFLRGKNKYILLYLCETQNTNLTYKYAEVQTTKHLNT